MNMTRALPNIGLSDCPPTYARLAAQGWDTVQEAFKFLPLPAFCDLLDAAMEQAKKASDDYEGVSLLDLNGATFKVHATGAKGGFRWRLSNDDILIFVGSPQRDWTVSVRYLSAGLWEHGLEPLRDSVFKALKGYVVRRDEDAVRTTRADWCFDFHCPSLAEEFRPAMAEGVVCHSGAKAQMAGRPAERGDKFDMWSRGARVETLTVGSKTGLQVQLYNKTLEIIEASGKEWLYPLWIAGLGGSPWAEGEKPNGMWRLECRFAGDFLKNRNVKRPDELVRDLSELIAEALYTRRLSIPTADSNRSRWPLSPLWSEAYRSRGSDVMLSIGRKVTGRRDQLVEQAVKQFAGSVRSATILQKGAYDPATAKALLMRALALVEADPAHVSKGLAAQDRYSDVEEAK